MLPILFRIGEWQARSSMVLLSLAVVAGSIFAAGEAKRMGYSKRDIAACLLLIIPAAICVGFFNGFLFLIGNLGGFQVAFTPFSDGIVSFGVVLAAYGLGWAAATWRKKPVLPFLDLISMTLVLMLAIYRIGCLLNGCCYGRVTDGLLGMYLPGAGGMWAYRYPTQIMLMVFDLMLFCGLLMYRRSKPSHGSLTLTFLLFFSIGRLAIDSLRELPKVLGPFSLHHLASFAILLITLYICFEVWMKERGKAS